MEIPQEGFRWNFQADPMVLTCARVEGRDLGSIGVEHEGDVVRNQGPRIVHRARVRAARARSDPYDGQRASAGRHRMSRWSSRVRAGLPFADSGCSGAKSALVKSGADACLVARHGRPLGWVDIGH